MVKFHGGGLVSSTYTTTVHVHTFNVIISCYTNISTSTRLYPKTRISNAYTHTIQVTGDCLYPDWIASFFIPLIHRTSFIVILPNYRLLPESSGADILADLVDFWTWLNANSVDSFLSSKDHGLTLDYEKVLVTGDSAGGYMALMSALTQPPSSAIKAVLAQYPMTNYLRCTPSETFMGLPSPKESELDHHLASMKHGELVSSAFPPQRTNISYLMAAYGRYLDYFGEDEMMWPVGLVREAGRKLPPTWIIHGDADTAVNVENSRKFVEKCKSVMGEEVEVRLEVREGMEHGFDIDMKEVEVRLEVREGMEHGFDIDMKEDVQEWLKQGLVWVEGKWLR
jgi:acetyl esterase/lipase